MLPDPSSAQSIGWLVLSCFALAGGLNQLHALTKRWRGTEDSLNIRPQPLIVRQDAEFVTRRDFEALQVEHRNEREHFNTRMREMELRIREEVKNDVAGLHEKMNSVALGVARLESSDNAKDKILEQMHGDLRELIQRDSRG